MPAIAEGFCVVLEGVHHDTSDRNIGAICYAGPIGGIQNVDGKHVLLNPEDFKFLEKYHKELRAKRRVN